MSLDLLFLRRPVLNYVSPPICEVIFSGSGSAVIVVEPFFKQKVVGLSFGLNASSQTVLMWDEILGGAICYTIYKSSTVGGSYSIIAECVNTRCGDKFCFVISGAAACYRVSAITTEGESELSDALCTS